MLTTKKWTTYWLPTLFYIRACVSTANKKILLCGLFLNLATHDAVSDRRSDEDGGERTEDHTEGHSEGETLDAATTDEQDTEQHDQRRK